MDSLRLPRSLLALVLLLAACGDDEGSDSTSSVSATNGSTAGTSSEGSSTVSTTDTPEESGPGSEAEAETAEASGPTTDGTSTSNADSGTTDGSGTTGGGGLECTKGNPSCGPGDTCRSSACCDGVGFCLPEDAAMCGGFIGEPCPKGLVCITDICVADGDGRCIEPELATAVQAEQPECWNAG